MKVARHISSGVHDDVWSLRVGDGLHDKLHIWYDIHIGEMCFIPMKVHNEQFNGGPRLRWQHLSPVVSTFSTSTRRSSSFVTKLCVLSVSFSLSSHLFLSFCGTPSRCFPAVWRC